MNSITIIGGGLAGCESAWQAAQNGRPCQIIRDASARLHQNSSDRRFGRVGLLQFAQIERFIQSIGLCSNGKCVVSIRSLSPPPMLRAFRRVRPWPLDRRQFAAYITEHLDNHPNVEICREEVTEIPSAWRGYRGVGAAVERAFGGFDSARVGQRIPQLLRCRRADCRCRYPGLRHAVSGLALRQRRGGLLEQRAFVEDKYDEFRNALLEAEKATAHNEEDVPYFESCMPIEELANRGRLTMRFGPLRGAV